MIYNFDFCPRKSIHIIIKYMKEKVKANTIQQLRLLFCLLSLSIGLYLNITENSIINNAILGLGIIVTNFTLNNPLNQ
jgi:hypothetical protein